MEQMDWSSDANGDAADAKNPEYRNEHGNNIPLETLDVLGWGSALNGELGLGKLDEDHVDQPTRLGFKHQIKQIVCGESHTLFVVQDGTVWTCGSNDHVQLGHDKCRNRPEKVEGLEGRKIVAVSAGYAHTLAVDIWGTLFSWGSDSHGQLGLQLQNHQDRLVSRPRIVKSLATKVIIQVAAGHSHSVVLTNMGEIYTCGSNSHGQLGLAIANGTSQAKFCLVELLQGFPTALITSGGFHSLALSVSGSVYGWGKNNYGQLGVSDTQDKYQPTQLSTLRSLGVRYMTAGLDHTVFLTQEGGVFTCGSAMYGQLGHNSFQANEILPRKILEFGSVVKEIACGRCHTLCLTNEKLYSFGLNSSGQLGHVGASRNSPMQITSLKHLVHSIYAGGDQSFILGLDSAIAQSITSISCDYREAIADKQILTITEESIGQMCSAIEPVDQDIMKLTEVLFASPACWNASFLLPNGEHAPCTWRNIGVDLNTAETILSRLSSVKAQGLRELTEQLVIQELLPKLPHQLKHVEVLRIYVLLPLLPLFYSGNSVIPFVFAERCLSLSPQLRGVVVNWLYCSPKDHVLRLISVYKRTILCVLGSSQSQSNKERLYRTCLNFLNLLCSANKTGMRLSYHTFTIPQLSTKIDVPKEYYNWTTTKAKFFSFCDYPFVFDAQAKTLLLQTDQIYQMQRAMNKAASQFLNAIQLALFRDHHEIQYLILEVSRDNIVQDVINQLNTQTTHDLKKPLKVKFVGEEAEDAGGVKKEFFLLLIREVLDPKYGMFTSFDESRLIWFNENSLEDNTMYFLIGLLCGLAIYNLIIINLPFPLALYKKLLDEKVDLNDMKELNPIVGRSFEQILESNDPDFSDIFNLTFEITTDVFGEPKVVPLKKGGSDIRVTQENKAEFVEAYITHVFHASVHKQFEAFKEGFERVCGSVVLKLFHAQELQAMVTGSEDYDWGELERNCTYKGGYHADDPTIKLFWDIFHSLDPFEKKQFLMFLSGSDRIPILGMRMLKMCIQPTGDERFLPVAHTCFNLLDLPRYQTRERLKYKLLQAIQQNQGFSLV